MQRRFESFRIAALALALAAAASLHAEPMGSAFTYQGELRSGGALSDGPYDFEVALYDAASGGSEIASVQVDDAEVVQGLFSLPVDFTGVPFEAGAQYWIELRVRGGAETGAYTALAPRQKLTATPYALSALGVRAGSIGAAEIDAGAVQRRVTGACSGADESIKSIAPDGSVTCETDDRGEGTITGVTAGAGLAGGGDSGAVTLSIAPGGVGAKEIDANAVQRRVAGACDPGSAIRAIGADGTVACEADDNAGGDVTAVIAGFGLSGGATSGAATLAADPAVLQRRVAASCPQGQSIRAIAEDGSVTCEVDDAPPGFSGWQIVTYTREYSGLSGGTASADGEARCPLGKRVVGGGVDSGCSGAYVTRSHPRDIPGSITTSGWWGHVLKRSDAGCGTATATMTVYAICASVN
jgi:hypothetical protein